ncbi:hypothetical protein PMAYCL1PPCAC_17688, partial [Pristionchus mayeri]
TVPPAPSPSTLESEFSLWVRTGIVRVSVVTTTRARRLSLRDLIRRTGVSLTATAATEPSSDRRDTVTEELSRTPSSEDPPKESPHRFPSNFPTHICQFLCTSGTIRLLYKIINISD